MQFAAHTNVSVEKSRAEIESILRKYGAEEFSSGWRLGNAAILFKVEGRTIRFVLPLPDKSDPAFTKTGGRSLARAENVALKLWEQACRQRWRALALCIKAKLEAIETGIASFEQEMMPYFVTSTGRTLSEELLPHLTEVISGRYLALPAPEEP